MIDEYGLIKTKNTILFRRIHFRLVHGYWCEHTSWTPGVIIDLGRAKLYRCHGCGTVRTR